MFLINAHQHKRTYYTCICEAFDNLCHCTPLLSNSHINTIELLLCMMHTCECKRTSVFENGHTSMYSFNCMCLTLICSIIEPLLVDNGVNCNGCFTEKEGIHSSIQHPVLQHLYLVTHTHTHTHSTHPVCLSPMISSLWPLPMGTKLSTALIPVCMGSRTEIRGIMPGAFRPTRIRWVESRGPCIQKNANTQCLHIQVHTL